MLRKCAAKCGKVRYDGTGGENIRINQKELKNILDKISEETWLSHIYQSHSQDMSALPNNLPTPLCINHTNTLLVLINCGGFNTL